MDKDFYLYEKNNDYDMKIMQMRNMLYIYKSKNVNIIKVTIDSKEDITYDEKDNLLDVKVININKDKKTCTKDISISYFLNDEEKKFTFKTYYINKNDESIYDKKLRNLNIKYSNLYELDIKTQERIYRILKSLMTRYNLDGLLRTIWISDNNSYALADRNITLTSDGLYFTINLNKKKIINETHDIEYVITHEYAYAIMAYIAFLKYGIKPGENNKEYKKLLLNFINVFTSRIGMDYSKKDKEASVSSTAKNNPKELIAESFAYFYTTSRVNATIISVANDLGIMLKKTKTQKRNS